MNAVEEIDSHVGAERPAEPHRASNHFVETCRRVHQRRERARCIHPVGHRLPASRVVPLGDDVDACPRNHLNRCDRVPERVELALERKPISTVVRPHEFLNEQTMADSAAKAAQVPAQFRQTRRSAAQQLSAIGDDAHTSAAVAMTGTNDKLPRQRVQGNASRRVPEPIKIGHATSVPERVFAAVPFIDQRARPGVTAAPRLVWIVCRTPGHALGKTMRHSRVARGGGPTKWSAPPFGLAPLEPLLESVGDAGHTRPTNGGSLQYPPLLSVTLTQRIASAGVLLPFEAVLRVYEQAVKIDSIRRRIYPRELDLVDRFLAALAIHDPVAIEAARRERCLATWANRSRRHYMRLTPDRQAERLMLAPDVEARLRSGALLLGAHFGCAFLTFVALARLNMPILGLVRGSDWQTYTPKCVRILDVAAEPPVLVALEALRALRAGGIVFLAGDLTGTDAVEVQVLGRTHRLVCGFADLSIASSVSATPVFSRIDQHGRIFTWMDSPLAAAPEGVQRARAALGQAYADRLSEIFAAYPGNVTPDAIERYLSAPASGVGR